MELNRSSYKYITPIVQWIPSRPGQTTSSSSKYPPNEFISSLGIRFFARLNMRLDPQFTRISQSNPSIRSTNWLERLHSKFVRVPYGWSQQRCRGGRIIPFLLLIVKKPLELNCPITSIDEVAFQLSNPYFTEIPFCSLIPRSPPIHRF